MNCIVGELVLVVW